MCPACRVAGPSREEREMARAERRATRGEGLTDSDNNDANVEEEEETEEGTEQETKEDTEEDTEEGGERKVADPSQEERSVTPDDGEVHFQDSVPKPEGEGRIVQEREDPVGDGLSSEEYQSELNDNIPNPDDDKMHAEENEQIPDINAFEDGIPDSNPGSARASVQRGEYPANDEYPEPATLNQRGTRLLHAAQTIARDGTGSQPHDVPPPTNRDRLRSIQIILEIVAEEVRRLVESSERSRTANAASL